MLKGYKNTKKQGDVGLGVAIGYFAKEGYTVCVPLTDSQDYDLIIDDTENIYRVQVKTTSFKNKYGVNTVNLSVKGGNRSGIGKIKKFDNTKVDLVFILTEDGTKYLIPSKLIKAKHSINLGKNYKKNIVI